MNSQFPNTSYPRSAVAHYALVFLLVAVGGWLVNDFWRERERTVAEVSRLAMHRSQLVSALFADTFIAADYVLSDMISHVDIALSRKTSLSDLASLVDKKFASVPGIGDLVLLDEHCRFVAMANRKQLLGTTSRQSFCSAPIDESGQNLHIQYMPAEKSANGKPVVLMSRVIVSQQRKMRAAVMAVVELDNAQHWIETFAVNPYDVQTILDRDGVVIARNPPLPDNLNRPIVAMTGQPSFDQLNGTDTFTARSPLDDRVRIFGLSRLERFPFIAIVGYDRTSALERWQQRAWQFACGYIALALLSIAFLRSYLQTITQSRTLQTLATTDALTGIANRRYLFEHGQQETIRAVRYSKPLSVLMIDIDLFKRINDRWGHPVGDRVIRNIADVLRSVLRASDICGRLGGEEFAAILPETDAQGASVLAERLRMAVELSEMVGTDDGQIIRHTVSVGISTLIPGDVSLESILQRADLNLYRAKESGRNRIAA